LVLLALASSPTLAIEPEPIKLGFLEVKPALDTKLTPFGSTTLLNGEQLKSDFLLVKPRITAFAAKGNKQLSTSFEILNGSYSASGAAPFIDWKVDGAVRAEPMPQHVVKVRAELFNTHEAVGAAFRNSADDAARFTLSTLNTSYEFGNQNDLGRLVLDATTFVKNHEESLANPRRNQKESNWGSTYHLNVLPGTTMQLQYRSKGTAWFDDTLDLAGSTSAITDYSQEAFAYVGASWETEARLAGKLKVVSGYKQTAVDGQRNRAHSNSWETNVRWRPMTGSVVTFNADRTIREQNGPQSAIDMLHFRYNWEYQWSHQLKSSIAGNYTGKTRLQTNKKEEGLGLKLKMEYAYTNWLNMFITAGHDQHRNANNGFSFSQQSIMLGVAASLEKLLGK
jgi:hypothetical protein